ncbi:lysine-2,3-aminomutase-like protein [Granulibacter bethesdensis]|uniref:lysine-2,3-aminomutase-like protein n=1 Tax=Granulibacter bethesdensis TaxID=364410 RepID=UPI00090C3A5A|nr:lysine-2,3-aminomutase-like protein [Granulibacter bethesdensis]APH59426.1 Lysine 2,3-aminomutase [Granulibacter bethesdensis]
MLFMPDGSCHAQKDDAERRPSSTPRSLRSLADLRRAGLIDDEAPLQSVAAQYAIAIPPAMQALITDRHDPIGLQVIPDPAEMITAPYENVDPIGDDALSPVPGIVHRYPDRALLKPLLICPVYCRFCFRREHVGPDGGVLSEEQLRIALDWLAGHPQIREVILTGGDPLMLSPRRLSFIINELNNIPHIDIIRIHSRVPVADPALVTQAMLDALETDKAMFLVLHTNNVKELTDLAALSIQSFQRRGIPVLSQTVLLRGVNDSAEALEALYRRILRLRVKPYYLHQLDAAPGTARFRVPVEEGRAILHALRGRISGLAWPTYVIDIPGGYGKVPVDPDYLESDGSVRDINGHRHILSGEALP